MARDASNPAPNSLSFEGRRRFIESVWGDLARDLEQACGADEDVLHFCWGWVNFRPHFDAVETALLDFEEAPDTEGQQASIQELALALTDFTAMVKQRAPLFHALEDRHRMELVYLGRARDFLRQAARDSAGREGAAACFSPPPSSDHAPVWGEIKEESAHLGHHLLKEGYAPAGVAWVETKEDGSRQGQFRPWGRRPWGDLESTNVQAEIEHLVSPWALSVDVQHLVILAPGGRT